MKEYQKIERQNLIDELALEKQKAVLSIVCSFLICTGSVAFVTYIFVLTCAAVYLGPLQMIMGVFRWIF